MKNSATNAAGGLRERKRVATRLAVTAAARALTAAHGVNGFTVEQVCQEAGISRRTFFNYFPAKEDAILGQPGDDIPEDLAEAFVGGAAGSGAVRAASGLSETLLDDFVDLATGIMDRMAISRQEVMALKQAVLAEPALLERAMRGSHDVRRVYAGLISRREGLPPDDPRIDAALDVMELLIKRSHETYFSPDCSLGFRKILHDRLALLRSIAAPPANPLSAPPAAPAPTPKEQP